MKSISIYVPEKAYQEFKAISERDGRPVAELIRQAMAEFLKREGQTRRSILDIPPHPSGKMLKRWTRAEVFDEMVKR